MTASGALQGRQDRGRRSAGMMLSRAQRPHHDEVVTLLPGDPRGARLASACPTTSAESGGSRSLGGSWISVVARLGDLLHRGSHGRTQTPAMAVHELTGMADGGDPGAGTSSALGGRLPGDDDLLHPAATAAWTLGGTPRASAPSRPARARPMYTVPRRPAAERAQAAAGAQDSQRERQVDRCRSCADRGEVDGRTLLSQVTPQVLKAARTRSRDSRTAASNRPTRVKPGRPWTA